MQAPRAERGSKKPWSVILVPVILAAVFPSLGLESVPQELKPFCKTISGITGALANLTTSRNASPLSPQDELTKYAESTVKYLTSGKIEILNELVLQDVRSYTKSVVFSTSASKKVESVLSALNTTNLNPVVLAKIADLVNATDEGGDQFGDFHMDEKGKATTFSVKFWLKHNEDESVEVALMVSGASFSKTDIKGTEVREEAIYAPETICHFWGLSCTTTRKEIGRRAVRCPVFDSSVINPREIEAYQNYLMFLSSRDALVNFKPAAVPEHEPQYMAVTSPPQAAYDRGVTEPFPVASSAKKL